MIGRERAGRLLKRFRKQRVLVVGDLMLDRYVAGSVTRISPEAPVPVVQVTDQYSRPGGAANVAANVRALGAQALVAGLVGDDDAGRELTGLLKSAGIETGGVLRVKGMSTTAKARIMADRQQVVRVDFEQGRRASDRQRSMLIRKVAGLLDRVSCVIVEDYGKGAVSQELADSIVEEAIRRGVPVGLDPNPGNDLTLARIALATPNYKEARSAAGLPEKALADDPSRDWDLALTGEILLTKWNPDLLVITLGPQGMYMRSRGAKPRVIPAKAREVFDVSGAGDTVVATAMLAVAAGSSFYEAVCLANCAAGVVVGKLGTAVCSPRELAENLEAKPG